MCACRIFSAFIHGSPLFFSLALFFSPVLPSGALAAASATSRWLCDATRRGAVEAVQRHGVRLPARRLGEGWPCVVKRAERRAASRAAGRLSAGLAPERGSRPMARLTLSSCTRARIWRDGGRSRRYRAQRPRVSHAARRTSLCF